MGRLVTAGSGHFLSPFPPFFLPLSSFFFLCTSVVVDKSARLGAHIYTTADRLPGCGWPVLTRPVGSLFGLAFPSTEQCVASTTQAARRLAARARLPGPPGFPPDPLPAGGTGPVTARLAVASLASHAACRWCTLHDYWNHVGAPPPCPLRAEVSGAPGAACFCPNRRQCDGQSRAGAGCWDGRVLFDRDVDRIARRGAVVASYWLAGFF